MTVREKWILRFARIAFACLGFAGPMLQARSSGAAMSGMFFGKSARFWHNTAFAVVRVPASSRHQQPASAVSGTFHGPMRVHVLAVLATERMVSTNMTLIVSPWAIDKVRQGPLSAYAAGTFLIYMTWWHHKWYLTGSVYVPFMPMGLESVRVTGLSDPLVKKIQLKIEKLIVLAHARE